MIRPCARPTFCLCSARRMRRATVALQCLTLAAVLRCGSIRAADTAVWQSTPYSIHLTIFVDDLQRPGLIGGQQLAAELARRAEASIGPLWQLEIAVAGAAPVHLEAEATTPTWDNLPSDVRAFDKLMWLSVSLDATGSEIRCREYDAYVRRTGPIVATRCSQIRMLPENCFQLLCDVFSPLAIVEPDPGDKQRVRMDFKGEGLPRRGGAALFAKQDDIYLPILRRTNRSGELLANGVLQLPWTLLRTGNDPKWTSVASGLRSPFGVRRVGFVEQLAIRAPRSHDSTTVRFFARHDEALGLAGYDVLLAAEDGSPPEQIGVTDSAGRFELNAQHGPIAMLYLRSGDRVLAKTPVGPGLVERVEIPISDDPARVLAESQSEAIQEELVDVVAQASILAARARAKLDDGDVAEARRLMAELNNLPGSSEFSLQINTAQRSREAQSSSERVQQKIDAQFADIRQLLTRFLQRRDIIALQAEVDAAGTDGS